MEKSKKTARAVFYARFASERVNYGEDAEQFEQGMRYIEEKGYELAGIYTDKGATGLHTNHPAINNLRADAAADKFDVVVVYDFSRISRNATAAREFLDEMSRCGVSVESVKQVNGGSLLCQLKRIK